MKTVSTASRTDDRIASYSAKGPTSIDHVVKPDIVAPGNRIISLLADRSSLESSYPENQISASYYTDETGNQQSSNYCKLSGTSMATPMVSGDVALLLDKDPSLTPDQVKARLMKSASKTFPSFSMATDPVTGETFITQYDIFTVGAGYLDVTETTEGFRPSGAPRPFGAPIHPRTAPRAAANPPKGRADQATQPRAADRRSVRPDMTSPPARCT